MRFHILRLDLLAKIYTDPHNAERSVSMSIDTCNFIAANKITCITWVDWRMTWQIANEEIKVFSNSCKHSKLFDTSWNYKITCTWRRAGYCKRGKLCSVDVYKMQLSKSFVSAMQKCGIDLSILYLHIKILKIQLAMCRKYSNENGLWSNVDFDNAVGEINFIQVIKGK